MIRVRQIFNIIYKRLPKTYPKSTLVIHETWKSLIVEYKRDINNEEKEKIIPVAFCNVEDNTVHLCRGFLKNPDHILALYILHEIGHIYAYDRYGPFDDKWADLYTAEKYADDFARRWVIKLQKENLI